MTVEGGMEGGIGAETRRWCFALMAFWFFWGGGVGVWFFFPWYNGLECRVPR